MRLKELTQQFVSNPSHPTKSTNKKDIRRTCCEAPAKANLETNVKQPVALQAVVLSKPRKRVPVLYRTNHPHKKPACEEKEIRKAT